MPITLDLMPLEDKLPETPPPKTIVVRYGYLKEIGEFPSDLTSKVGCGSKLILRTDRGTEIGEMLTTLCGNGGCNKSITRDKLLDYIDKSGGRDYPFTESGRVLRSATTQDLAEQAKLDEQRPKQLQLARELVQQHHLQMKIVAVEPMLGGERILFYFVSEQRIDFRNLVRDLAHALHTRIELRQIGARDEARITADYEKCGQHCCCKQFLKVLTPISMRAAKVQKATLDPTKISGRCGRLMCCLRYEDETYEELRKKLPKRNTRVQTENGDAWVIDGQILTQLVLVQYDDFKREAVPMEKIVAFDRPKPVLPDGRTMQTPNDRPPPGMDARPPRGGPGGPPPRGPGARPKPGAPVQAPEGDPLAKTGPTGGDLNTGAPAGPRDEIDDLIADAMDDVPPPSAIVAPTPAVNPSDAPTGNPPAPSDPGTVSVEGTSQPHEDDPWALPPAPKPPQAQQRPLQQGGPRPQGGPGGPRPPKGNFPPRGPGGPQNRGPGGPRPQQNQPRGPQGFRPPKPQGPRPPQGQRPPTPPAPPPAEGSAPPPPPPPPPAEGASPG